MAGINTILSFCAAYAAALPGLPGVKLSEYLKKHEETGCPRPDLRLAHEDERFRTFVCLTCHELWAVSRSKAKQKARYEVELERVRELTDAERARTGRVFGSYYQGQRHG
jgi:hypothetical protein